MALTNKILNVLVLEARHTSEAIVDHLKSKNSFNLFCASSMLKAKVLLQEKWFGIALIDIDYFEKDLDFYVEQLTKDNQNTVIVLTSKNKDKLVFYLKKFRHFTMDYLVKPYIDGFMESKLNVYKRLYFERKSSRLLINNILPVEISAELRAKGKVEPKRHEDCAVLFTDFFGFTRKTRRSTPEDVVEVLERHFSDYDEIMARYKIEKIKTIGDAYMAVSGVTENIGNNELRILLAALELRHYANNDILTQRALNREQWEVRIGIHCGDLVAGVIGKHKFTFDVWGDSVNVAARCEQNGELNEVNVSAEFFNKVEKYVEAEYRGEIPVKNAAPMGMYFIKGLKPEFAKGESNDLPNKALLKSIGISCLDFEGLRQAILHKLKAELEDDLVYHSYGHTVRVEKAVLDYAYLENLDREQTVLLRTAAIFHDSGFLIDFKDNEKYAVYLLKKMAPFYGYNEEQISTISAIIMATASGIEPTNLMEQIMCDADHDYLGRKDYHKIAQKLYREMINFGAEISEAEWIRLQLNYLKNNHKFYTTTAQNLRQPKKDKWISELKVMLAELEFDLANNEKQETQTSRT